MGDKAALLCALRSSCDTVLFIASQKKMTRLKEKLGDQIDQARMDKLISPAGLNIGAIGPAEIAVSIIAQLISLYRTRELPDE